MLYPSFLLRLGKPRPTRIAGSSIGVVRVLWLCLEGLPGSVGVLEKWRIGFWYGLYPLSHESLNVADRNLHDHGKDYLFLATRRSSISFITFLASIRQ